MSKTLREDCKLMLATYAMIMGETYLFIDWNAAKGDLSPAYVKAKEKNKNSGRIPMLDEHGQQVVDPQGEIKSTSMIPFASVT
jgi:hypothetical protein